MIRNAERVWELVDARKDAFTALSDRVWGMTTAAKAMAGMAVGCLRDPDLIASAKADLAERTRRGGYVCPTPDEVAPPLKPVRSVVATDA
jgi:hypothetical protein